VIAACTDRHLGEEISSFRTPSGSASAQPRRNSPVTRSTARRAPPDRRGPTGA
jgi:hypothetical protein